jgi:predicted transposase YbfD/YdcC
MLGNLAWRGKGISGTLGSATRRPEDGPSPIHTNGVPCVSRPAPASILNYFRDLPDPRRETRNKKHRLIDILVIAICGTIAGCQSAVEIAAYGRAKREWLKTFLELPNGIPSHDTFSRVFQLLDARKFHDCFVAWVRALHELTRGQVVPIDGKALRRSFDSASDLPALHLVSAWAAENRLVLGEVPVDGKSNEITAIPKLLEILELTGAIVTIDALGCQKEIAAKIREKGADYVLAVKENQPHLYEDLSDHFDRVLEDEELLPRGRRHATEEKNRGRAEHRTYISTPVPKGLRNRAAWRDLSSVGCVVSVVQREGKETVEVRYFISSQEPDAKRLAKAVRGHWGIENSQHWVLDVVFQEDQCRARLDDAAENLALLRRLAMNLMATEGTKHASLRVKGRTAGWDDDLMAQILTAGTT